MQIIRAKQLDLNDFREYGQFADLIHANTEKIGEPPIIFFRDMISVFSGTFVNGYSVVKTNYREMIIDEVEQHSSAVEVLLPLDGDVIIFVSPSTNKVFSEEKTEAFIVPKGTIIALKAGVWHKAPFPISNDEVNSLVVLPERTYANDSIVIKLEEPQKIKIIH
jgi:ureidoglycolate lyase